MGRFVLFILKMIKLYGICREIISELVLKNKVLDLCMDFF